jgi:uncharacterized protein YdgA (DUF945 family)
LKRKTVTIAAAVVVVALAAAYPASSWFIGKLIETAHGKIDAEIAARPYFKLISHDYERGLFDARDTITIEIPAALSGASSVPTVPEESPDAPEASPAPLRLTFKTAIRHGPLFDAGALVAGSAVTVVEFDEAVRQKALEVFGGKPALEIRTLYGLTGGGRFALTSPAVSVDLPGRAEDRSATLSGGGLEITGEFAQGRGQYSLRGAAPRFELAEAGGRRIAWTGLAVESRQQRLLPDEPLLYVGPQQFTLDGLEIDPGEAPNENGSPMKLPKIVLTDIRCDMETEASGEFVDSAARISAAGLRIDEQDFGPAAYDFSLKHLNARKLMALNRASLAFLDAMPDAPQDRKQLAQAFAPMQEHIIALLLDDPILSIDRLAFNTPDGEAKISASVKLNDVRAEDFARLWVLFAKLDAAADLALPIPLVTALAASDAEDETEAEERGELVEQAIARFVELGYATADDGIFRSRFAFRGGQTSLNDKPFNPLAMALELAKER